MRRRFNVNGTPDTTFAPGGKTTTSFGTTTNDDAHGLSVATNGRFVIAGASSGDFGLARYLGDTNVGPDVCGGHLTHKAAVAPGGTVSGTLATDDAVDLYPITAAAGQTLGFDVYAAAGSSLDSYLRVFDSAGNEIIANDNGKPVGKVGGAVGESYVSYTFTTGGTYYVGISGAPNTIYDFFTGFGAYDASFGAYIFSITDLSTGGVDTNDQISEATSIIIGSTTSGSILTSTDVNVYKYTVVAGQRVSFNINTSAGSTFDSYLRIFNSSGVLLASNDNGVAAGESAALSSYIEYTFVTGGTYYVGVSARGTFPTMWSLGQATWPGARALTR